MQENQDASKETQEPKQKDRVRDFLSRPEITGISIAVWLFVGGFFLLRLYIYDHIPVDPSRTMVLIDSMFSLVLAIVVILQSVIYAQQAKFMKEQSKASTALIELMVLTELPYMRIGDWKPPRICENGRLHIQAKVRNSGRTMAWDVATGCPPVRIGKQVRGSLPLIPLGEDTWITYGALDSKEGMVIKFDALQVTDEQAAQLQSGKLNIFVDGVCRYQDSMGGKSYYTYGFTLNLKRNITPRYERHHRLKVNRDNPAENREGEAK